MYLKLISVLKTHYHKSTCYLSIILKNNVLIGILFQNKVSMSSHGEVEIQRIKNT